MVKLNELVGQLKAAGEITRMRLLVLLSLGELSVKDLTEILEQSQPRISRHLKLLTDAGLVVRHAEGAWAYFGINSGSEQAQLVYSLVSRLEINDIQLRSDRERLAVLRNELQKRAEDYFAKVAKSWDRLRGLHVSEEKVEAAICSLLGSNKYDALIDLGTGTGRMLELLHDKYHQGIGVDFSREMISVARAKLASANISNAIIRLGDIGDLGEYEKSADLTILHQVLHYFDDPGRVLASAASVLKPDGEMLIVDFAPHKFDFFLHEHAHRRLGLSHEQMRGWARGAGLEIVECAEIPNGDDMECLTVCLWVLKNRGVTANEK